MFRAASAAILRIKYDDEITKSSEMYSFCVRDNLKSLDQLYDYNNALAPSSD